VIANYTLVVAFGGIMVESLAILT